MFLNAYDFDRIAAELEDEHFERPNLAHAASIVTNLARWADRNSDGWVHWPKPGRAAERLTNHLYREYLGRYDARTGRDISDAELKRGIATIKSFLTRNGFADDAAGILA